MKDSQDWLHDLEMRIGFLRQWLNEDRIPNPPIKDPESWRSGVFSGEVGLRQELRNKFNDKYKEVSNG